MYSDAYYSRPKPQESRRYFKASHKNSNHDSRNYKPSFKPYSDSNETCEQMNLYWRTLAPYNYSTNYSNYHCEQSYNNKSYTNHQNNPTANKQQYYQTIPRRPYDTRYSSDYKRLPFEVKLKIGRYPRKPETALQLYVKDKVDQMKKMGLKIPNKQTQNSWFYQADKEMRKFYEEKSLALVKEFNQQVASYQENRRKVLDEYYREEENKQNREKPKSAFRLFKRDHAARLKYHHPNAGFKERSEMMKSMWKNLPSQEKVIYAQRAKLEKER